MSVPFLRSKITVVILSLLAIWTGVLAVTSSIRRYSSDAEIKALAVTIDDTERENARLAQEVQRMQEPQWLALLARQRLNYQQPDETVVFVYKSEKSDTISPPNTPQKAGNNWQKWWDWLRGR